MNLKRFILEMGGRRGQTLELLIEPKFGYLLHMVQEFLSQFLQMRHILFLQMMHSPGTHHLISLGLTMFVEFLTEMAFLLLLDPIYLPQVFRITQPTPPLVGHLVQVWGRGLGE